ncbi:EutP/PduV family microcompartment system protein [Buttiauxella noackiae]|uniref:EutP/PduV family microcompartment system protein n=1 Tax=Buttiauxella noackiae TaxID=82992 RepID=UPI000550FB3A|nr:EutP/PduV family microcompartment system protein [Buttiauxella noackiae]
MKRIVFVGTVGAGKTTLFNALQGNYSLARKTQAVEFSDVGNIDTPGEFLSHPRLYSALINTLVDAELLIYVHAANDPQCRIPAGLLDIYPRLTRVAVINKIDLPEANIAQTQAMLIDAGFTPPIFALNSLDAASVRQLEDYLAEECGREEPVQ